MVIMQRKQQCVSSSLLSVSPSSMISRPSAKAKSLVLPTVCSNDTTAASVPSPLAPILRLKSSEIPVGSPDFSLYSSDQVILSRQTTSFSSSSSSLLSSSSSTHSRRRPTYTFEKTPRVQTLLWRGIYTLVVAMYFGGYRQYRAVHSMYQDMLQQQQQVVEQRASEANVQSLQRQVRELQGRLEHLTTINQVFHHELRMIDEMATESELVDMKKMGMLSKTGQSPDEILSSSSSGKGGGGGGGGDIARWIRQRKRGLEHRIHILQAQVQEQSKQTVLEKYGPGPYRVKFTVHILYDSRPNGFDPVSGEAQPITTFARNRGTRIKKNFVVELAPLDQMPHAIHLFLELIESKLWNDSIFLHHEDSDHVMSVAPVDYVTHNLKVEQLDALSHFSTLGFPEYSPAYPHEKYTLGFAGMGPTFYINTLDNVELHGPGGQDHFLLPNDADPCFGKVIQGHQTIDLLVKSGIQVGNRLNPNAAHPWKEEDVFWTRISSVDILR